MPYGVERDEPIRRSRSRPRGITERHAAIVQPTRTALDEPGPETNLDPEAVGSLPIPDGVRFGGDGEPVEATRTEPGGVAVVEVPAELDRPDDDSHVVDGELVEREPIVPAGTEPDERDDGRPPGSLPEPEGGVDVFAPGDEASSVAYPGTPGTIEPELDPRPSTLLELADAARAEGPRWPPGAYVLYSSGKRAHWNGEAWRSGEAPGGS